MSLQLLLLMLVQYVYDINIIFFKNPITIYRCTLTLLNIKISSYRESSVKLRVTL